MCVFLHEALSVSSDAARKNRQRLRCFHLFFFNESTLIRERTYSCLNLNDLRHRSGDIE